MSEQQRAAFEQLRNANDAMIAAMPLLSKADVEKLQLAMGIVCQIAEQLDGGLHDQ